jgi:predicted Zn-dependent peptidase
VNSVAIGIIIKNGSIHENINNNGVSHFIEHMLFKGTKNRNAKEIAESIDNVGGQLNAFTGKEQTCFYAKVLDQHLPIAIDVLGDMLSNSLFIEEEIQKEKGVIIEEINMYLDEPEDLVYELLNELMFKNTSLEYPILGNEHSVSTLNRENMLNYFYEKYNAEDIVISLAGKFDTKETMKLLNENFNNFKKEKSKLTEELPNEYIFKNNIKGIDKKIEQLNFCIGLEGTNSKSDDIHPTLVMNNIFGGSMSSRLFQSIREDKGLAYSVYSILSPMENTGIFSIYAGLKSSQLIQVVKLIKAEIEYIEKQLITKEELHMSKEQFKGNYILGTEGTFSRMFENGKSLSLLGKIESPDEVIKKIDRVNMEDIERVVKDIFNKEKVNIAYVGQIKDSYNIENQLKEILFN